MNYFELFNIPVSLHVDPATIKKTFYELSRKYHPDFYTNKTDADQAEALEISSMINKAYRVFQSEDETIRYVLMLKGLMEEEEKYTLKPAFLMEVMEINEGLMELEMDNDPQKLNELKQKSDELLKEIYEEVAPIIENYRDGVTTTEELLQVKDYYYKKKYLKRILESISGIPNIASRS
jgi:molecular chaperone HscB